MTVTKETFVSNFQVRIWKMKTGCGMIVSLSWRQPSKTSKTQTTTGSIKCGFNAMKISNHPIKINFTNILIFEFVLPHSSV